MSMFIRIFQNRRSTRTPTTRWYTPEPNVTWNEPSLDSKEIRLVLYRDHDLKGRHLLFDSKAVHRVSDNDQAEKKACRFACSSRKPPPTPQDGMAPKYTFTRPGSDTKMLEEMVFGSVAMAYRGSTLKVHTIRSPPQLLLSGVFIPATRPAREAGGEGENLDSYSLNCTASGDFTTPQRISGGPETSYSIAHSVPVDVPTPPNRELSLEAEDSGFSTSFNSNASSLTTSIPTPSSSASMNSNSLTSLQRRWRRNQQTSLEHNILKRQSDEGICEQPVLPAKRPAKIGMGIVFNMREDETGEAQRSFQKFFFSHITLIEGHFKKLQLAIERAMGNHRKIFLHQTIEALESFRLLFEDLLLAPRLQEPVWLNMMSYSTHRVVLCQVFLQELMLAVEKYDTKSTKFFLSTLITAVLTHHLAWVPTVTPAGATPSRTYLDKHSAKWLDAVAKSHPYNPLWAQLGDLYGAIGFPLRLSRTVVIGKKGIVSKMLYILSYFIRCSEVLEKMEHSHDFENLDPEEAEENFQQSSPGQGEGLDGGLKEDAPSPARCMCGAPGQVCHPGNHPSYLCSCDRNLSDSVLSDSSASNMSKSGSTIVSVEEDTVDVKLKGGGQASGNEQSSCPQPGLAASHHHSNNESVECSYSQIGPEGLSTKRPSFESLSVENVSAQSLKTFSTCQTLPVRAVVVQPSEVPMETVELVPLPDVSAERVDSGIYDASNSDEKCQLSPTFVQENVKVERVRHIGRSSIDREDEEVGMVGVGEGAEQERPCRMSPTQPNEHTDKMSTWHVGRSAKVIDSGVCESAPEDLPSLTGEKDKYRNRGVVQFSGCDRCETREGDEYSHDSGVYDTNSGTFFGDPFGVVPCRHNTLSDKASVHSDTATNWVECIHEGSTCDVHHPKLPVRPVVYNRTSSMFDEYFEEEDPVSLPRVTLLEKKCKVEQFKRMASIEGSNSIFDEYLDMPCLDLSPTADSSESSMKNNVKAMPESLETSPSMFDEYFMEDNPAGCHKESEEDVELPLHLSDRRNVARPQALVMTHQHDEPSGHLDRQTSNISATTLTPRRCKSVTPTKLGRMRHVSSLSNTSSIDADFFLSLKELNLPSSEPCDGASDAQSFERNFGRSLLAGFSPHYLSDFVLHGTSDQNFQAKLQHDLSMSVQNSVLDEPITEAVCILADVDNWSVRLQTCRYDTPDRFQTKELAASQLICNIIESVHALWKLKMSPEFCLMHLEDRLQEIFFKSRTLAEYIRLHRRVNIKELAALFKFDVSDMPLLLAVAGTHTSHLSLALL